MPPSAQSKGCDAGAACSSLPVPESICQRFDHLGLDDSNRTYRLGIMGGTFDPIHMGHLACAEQARVAFGLDAVIFMPAGMPVFKLDKQVTDGQTRLDMCHLATASNPHFGVSSLEVEREGKTYTADTLRQMRAFYPENVELYFITGADAVLSICKWRDSHTVAKLAHIIAVARPGAPISEELKAEMASESGFDIQYLEAPALSISSSMLRRFVRTGNSIRYLVTFSVYDFIKRHGLYVDGPEEGE